MTECIAVMIAGSKCVTVWSCLVQVSFEIADITTCEMAKESYDVVYSRDTILHIHDKPALFKR